MRYMPAVQFIVDRLGVRGNGARVVPMPLADETERKWPGFLSYCSRNGYLRGTVQPAAAM